MDTLLSRRKTLPTRVTSKKKIIFDSKLSSPPLPFISPLKKTPQKNIVRKKERISKRRKIIDSAETLITIELLKLLIIPPPPLPPQLTLTSQAETKEELLTPLDLSIPSLQKQLYLSSDDDDDGILKN